MAGQDRRDPGRLRRPRRPARSRSTPSWPSIEAQEVAKKAELAERKALLAERLRSAYDTDRTSLLETFLSGGTFTDLLAEMSYYIDVGEQDKALAEQIAQDQETLAALHQATEDTRSQTERPAPADGRPEARARPEPGASSRPRKAAAQAAREADRRGARARRSGRTPQIAAQQGGAPRRRSPRPRPPRRSSQDQIAALIRQAAPGRQHPVGLQRHADLADGGRRDPELRLHRVLVGAAARVAAPHFHQRHRHRRPVRHAGPAPRATGRSSTSAGTMPTAPTRPGS